MYRKVVPASIGTATRARLILAMTRLPGAADQAPRVSFTAILLQF
jgi:hypothetical protein